MNQSGYGNVVDDRSARVAWCRVAEPADLAVTALAESLGPLEAWNWMVDHAPDSEGVFSRPVAAEWAKPLRRWGRRLRSVDAQRDLQAHAALGGVLLTPDDAQWPQQFADLGLEAPLCLWVRGTADLAEVSTLSASVVGARACTEYGTRVAGQMAVDLAESGVTVVSGGAYGIDAAAHRGALAVGGPTVIFLAGGVDRLYPAGNARLFEDILAQGGLVVSEAGPGAIPARSRFLLRNRLIAALSRATIVVEAARRSGALATAHRASELLRPVGAVPGPVTSFSSAGCHELLRSGEGVCVTSGADALELVEPLTAMRAPDRHSLGDPPSLGEQRSSSVLLDADQQTVLGALSRRSPRSSEHVASATRLTLAEVQGALGLLEIAQLVGRKAGGWVLSFER